MFQNIARTPPVSVTSSGTEHFLTHRHDVADFFKNKKQFLMESFYRSMRKKHEVLMDNGTPEGEL
ncbi:MAG: cryptochrome/photolyase family protein [Desulfobacterales bacterium]